MGVTVSVITKVLKQKCVYWAPGTLDGYGQPSYLSAIELDCRWASGSTQIIKQDGTITTSTSVVMLSQDVVIGGVLMLGTLEDVTDLIYPTKNEGAFEIIQFHKVPNFKNTENMRVAFL
jgi:hypothetical protein